MAVLSVAIEPRKGQQDTFGEIFLWTQRSGELTGIPGRSPAHLTSRNQPLANNEAARCSSIARKPAHPRGCLANAQLAAVDKQMGRATSSNCSMQHFHDPRRPAGYESEVTADTVSRLCQEGRLAEAVETLGIMVDTDCRISVSLIYWVLKECVAKKDLILGRRVHALSVQVGYESDTFLCNNVMRMYASNGRLQEAMDVFTLVPKPDTFTWSAIISAHVRQGQDSQALELYHEMCRSGVKPDGYVFVAALQACARGADLKSGQQVHADVLASGAEGNLFVCSCLVDMYAKCGSLKDAQQVFDGLPRKDLVTWSAMLAGYSKQGMGQKALLLHREMQEEGIVALDSVTFVCLLQACASVGTPALEKGRQLHAQVREQGFQADVFVASSLVNMYAKCGSIEDARAVFDGPCLRNVVLWNAMIGGYSQQGMGQEALHLYRAMQKEGVVTPNSVTFVCLLQACGSLGTLALEEGKQLNAQITEQGLEADVFVANSLVTMYAKCGSLCDAQGVFDGLPRKDVVTWNAMIAGYSQKGMGTDALHLLNAMQQEGMAAPNSVTFVSLLQACASVGTTALDKGKQLHAEIRERGLQADVFVANSLLNMYAKCGRLEHAQSVFDDLPHKDVVTWNAMIAGYAQQGMGSEALNLFIAMQQEGLAAPNSVTFVSLLQACASVGTPALEKGRQLHGQIREQGLQADVFVANSLVNMYAKCGSLEDAQVVFDGLSQKDVVTWNAMIAGYSHQGMGQEALDVYRAMQVGSLAAPDSVTFVCLLQACASLGALALQDGKQLHAQIREQGLQADVFVASSLVNMYAKCSSLEDAREVFNGLGEKNVVTWSTMIAGYAQQGMEQEALGLYRSMQDEGLVAPNSVTFVCLLQASANVAALHLGRQLHAQVKKEGLQADVLVAGSLINMYGKCGSMVDAQEVFETLPKRDIVAWNALIAGYTRQGNSELVFDLVVRMQEDGILPDSITFLSIFMACSHTGQVTKGREYFEAMSRHYGIIPTVDHYTGMVDLLGRAGQLDEALALIRKMTVSADATVWHTLLSACRKWTNVDVGRHAFDEAMKLDTKDAAAYVLMSNIYCDAQMWEQAQELQARRKGIRAWKQPGQSWWTDMDGLVHSFLVDDRKHRGIAARLTGKEDYATSELVTGRHI